MEDDGEQQLKEEDNPHANEDTPLLPNDANNDKKTQAKETSLLSRRLARCLSTRFPSWYPQNGRFGNCNLDDAWEYFERLTLPRRMKNPENDEDDKEYIKAPRGIKSVETWLYPLAYFGQNRTNMEDINDFGIGMAVYFSTLRQLIVILFVAGLLYTPNFLYYRSTIFNGPDDNNNNDYTIDVQVENIFLQGSLICDQSLWVPCPNCTTAQWHRSKHRIAHSTTTSGANGESLVFALKNNCAPLRWQEGVNHLVVVLFLIFAILRLGEYQRRKELEFDESVLTASDYSIRVHNPPSDAIDPNEWKDFFSQVYHQYQKDKKDDKANDDNNSKDNNDDVVAYVSVILDNNKIVNLLAERRKLVQELEYGAGDTDADFITTKEKIDELETKCRAYYSKENPHKNIVTDVFITFQYERMQRDVLRSLTSGIGKVHIKAHKYSQRNKDDAIKGDFEEYPFDAPSSNVLFRNEHLLDISEVGEPSAIRYQDLCYPTARKWTLRFVAFSITGVIYYIGFMSVYYCYFNFDDEDNDWIFQAAAILIVLLNIIVPQILRALTIALEAYPREAKFQVSLYLKVGFFRWINTAILTSVYKAGCSTLEHNEDALIPSIYGILKAEIIIAPIMHMLDIVGNIKRLILAPYFAKNQLSMNFDYFDGAPGSLGVKFTGITKVVFLCFFYAVIFPSSFFFGSGALLLTYFTERFNLLRTWAPMPQVGNDVAALSGNIFFPLSIFALSVVTIFYWSAYPFDMLCETGQMVGDGNLDEYIGTHNVVIGSSTNTTIRNKLTSSSLATITVNGDTPSPAYYFCDQQKFFLTLFTNEIEFDAWMSDDQWLFSIIFMILCGLVTLITSVNIVINIMVPKVKKYLGSDYTTMEIDSGERYVDQPMITAYVPQVKRKTFAHPLLACDISEINTKHIGWIDQDRGYSYYDLSKDIREIMTPDTADDNVDNVRKVDYPLLGIVRQYDN